jgi:hypothetical protein
MERECVFCEVETEFLGVQGRMAAFLKSYCENKY